MAKISDLNIHDIYRIIYYAVGGPTNSISSWTQKLTYLHICSLWSGIAAPLVLSECYIEFDHYSDGTICKTNLSILKDRDLYCDFVTHFYINVKSPIEFSGIFRDVCAALARHLLRFVRTLKIDISSGAGDYTNLNTMRESGYTYTNFTNVICMCMPGVTNLTFLEPDSLFAEIVVTLLRSYRYQLEYLYVLGPVNLKAYLYAPYLNFLRIQLGADYITKPTPIVNSALLRVLSLSDVPAYYIWLEFKDYLPSIKFSSLETLEVSFLDFSAYAGSYETAFWSLGIRAPKLHFPKLNRLTISNCPPQSSLLECQTYFSNLHTVSISGAVDSVAHSMRMGLLQQEYLNIYIDESRPMDRDTFNRTTNYLFGSLITHTRASFVVDVDIGLGDIQGFMWPNLTNLILYRRIDSVAFIMLVLKLPNLVSVMARNLIFDISQKYAKAGGYQYPGLHMSSAEINTRQQIYNVFSPFEAVLRNNALGGSNVSGLSLQRLEQLSATRESRRVQTLSLYYGSSTESNTDNCAFVLFAAALFPSLEVLEVDMSIGYHRAMTKELREMIPHFKNLNIRHVHAEEALDKKISDLEFFV